MADKLRVGVIGVGVGKAHIRGYQACPNADLVALCDADEVRLRDVGEQFGVRELYTDYKEMLALADLDAVSVALPNVLHAPVSIAAMEAGKHVLCEKPLASTLADAEKMVQTSRDLGKTLMIMFNYRYRNDAQFVKRAIGEGQLGHIYHARCGWVRRRGIPKAGGWFTRKAMSGGGPLIDLGVHMLDLTMWFMGHPKVVAVSGSTHNLLGCAGKGSALSFDGHSYDVEDHAAALLRLEGGGTIALEISWASYSSASDDYYVHLWGDQSGAELSVHNYERTNTVRLFGDLDGQPIETRPQLPETIGGHEGAVCEFVSSILEGRPPASPAEQGLVIARLLDAIYRSAETGREVRLA